MSAYLVDDVKIGIIGKCLFGMIDFDPRLEMTEEKLVRVLLVQNLRSLDARYPQHNGNLELVLNDWAGNVTSANQYARSGMDEAVNHVGTIDNARLLDLFAEFEYQSCESADWEKTLSCQAVSLGKAMIQGTTTSNQIPTRYSLT
jgi:hypothetical protein